MNRAFHALTLGTVLSFGHIPSFANDSFLYDSDTDSNMGQTDSKPYCIDTFMGRTGLKINLANGTREEHAAFALTVGSIKPTLYDLEISGVTQERFDFFTRDDLGFGPYNFLVDLVEESPQLKGINLVHDSGPLKPSFSSLYYFIIIADRKPGIALKINGKPFLLNKPRVPNAFSLTEGSLFSPAETIPLSSDDESASSPKDNSTENTPYPSPHGSLFEKRSGISRKSPVSVLSPLLIDKDQ